MLEGLSNILLNNDVILQVEIFDKRETIIKQFLKSKNFNFLKSIKRDFYFKNF